MLDARTPTLIKGLRGLVTASVEVTSGTRDVHPSGLYGGAVASAAEALAVILGHYHDAHGRVLLPGFYPSVRDPTPAQRRSWAMAAPDDGRVVRSAGAFVTTGEAGYTALLVEYGEKLR